MFAYDQISKVSARAWDKMQNEALETALDNAEALASADGAEPQAKCCTLPIAKCVACAQGQTEQAYCDANPETIGCDLSPEDPTKDGESEPQCCNLPVAKCFACQAYATLEDYCLYRP